MSMDHGTRNFALATAFVDELARAGVRYACVCPGSRSTPLAIGLAHHPSLRVSVHVDERSAAFFALGMARACGEPVALLCSSGTAAANFLPAIVEAYYARVPLIVLTADRPPELRDVGAAQTIDQLRLYGGHVKWFVDMPVPELIDDLLRHARVVADRAVATARSGPAGPVHLNFPFREPLMPTGALSEALSLLDPVAHGGRPDNAPYAAASRAPRPPDRRVVAALAADLAATPRGLIVCGPQSNPALAEAVTALATALNYPVLADPLSQVRCGGHDRALIVDSYDAFLRDESIGRELAPEVVLRIGAIPTSKPLALYLQRFPGSRHVLLGGDGDWRDPMRLASDVLDADPCLVCHALADAIAVGQHGRASCEWHQTWLAIASATREAIATHLAAETDLFEGRVFAELADLLPDGATLFAGNSMPVRDLDTFFPAADRAVTFLANRGANGIDGVVSSALGVAAVSAAPLVLVIGDLSFYHDLNGLLAAKKYGLRATIIVLNNDGGGIFSFLPQATTTEQDTFEELFGTPIGLDVESAAALYGATFARPATWTAFREAVAAGLAGDGLTVVEVVTDRGRNVAQHRAVWAAVAARLQARAASWGA
ncbi:MAG: 2-succinyl-5-enolpyruvyl-6-hydroxy-3-cyclohexene-carboxylate synthase [Thermomicrobiales bacterium]|nr:2-succinyl-5-enolpyruvyl-6-hydroxy-3-cyclohexene-carboxylate synthase [Thermomicrobiales bacterium]